MCMEAATKARVCVSGARDRLRGDMLGNDLHLARPRWLRRKMRAPSWSRVKNPENRQHRINTCRVLLTRARAGMAILIPPVMLKMRQELPPSLIKSRVFCARPDAPILGSNHPNYGDLFA